MGPRTLASFCHCLPRSSTSSLRSRPVSSTGTHGRVWVLAAIVALAGCASDPGTASTAVSVEPSASTVASTSTTRPAATWGTQPATPSMTQPDASFPTALFAAIGKDPVSEEGADEFLAILNDMADGSGVAATVMSTDGTWSGAAGKADGVRDVEVDSQFAIASITKTVIAAQVMQMVEAGELGLDDPATDHLPAVDFDANGATIRQLLGMRSRIPDYDSIFDSLATDRQRRWTTTDVLALVAADRSPAGDFFEYSSTNYVLLGLIIEQVRGRAVADVLRDGVLGAVGGMERLVYQPDEARPSRWRCPTASRAPRSRRAVATCRHSRGQRQAARRVACHRTRQLSGAGGERSVPARSSPRPR